GAGKPVFKIDFNIENLNFREFKMVDRAKNWRITIDFGGKPGLCRFFQELVPKPCAFSAPSISFGTSSNSYAIWS
ncbi:MAG: hypothetical protein LBD96_00340, partial [Treponema sp.]|nr:hypothetical protein [Treponema sp.]